MKDCPTCHKGYVSHREYNVETLKAYPAPQRNTIELHHEYYEFCSNVLCDWDNRRRELLESRFDNR